MRLLRRDNIFSSLIVQIEKHMLIFKAMYDLIYKKKKHKPYSQSI